MLYGPKRPNPANVVPPKTVENSVLEKPPLPDRLPPPPPLSPTARNEGENGVNSSENSLPNKEEERGVEGVAEEKEIPPASVDSKEFEN